MLLSENQKCRCDRADYGMMLPAINCLCPARDRQKAANRLCVRSRTQLLKSASIFRQAARAFDDDAPPRESENVQKPE
jgi:hypothetical protein